MIKLKQGSEAYGFKTISYPRAKLSDNIIKGAHSIGDVVYINARRKTM